MANNWFQCSLVLKLKNALTWSGWWVKQRRKGELRSFKGLLNRLQFHAGFKSNMCYNHNKCRFRYYVGYSVIGKQLFFTKKAKTGSNWKIKHTFIFVLIIPRSTIVMIVTHGWFKTWFHAFMARCYVDLTFTKQICCNMSLSCLVH